MPFQIEEFFGVWLDYLQEYGHPLVERVIKCILYQAIIDTVCPANTPQAHK